MVGLYGVGGLGKTTMCKIMANFYISVYTGKSCHIEFPSDGDDQKIVQECRKALRKLANLSDEHLLNKADSLDQVVQLMRENLRRYDVFLALDNVWESSLEATKRILEVVSFSANSKILLTSRSEEVLKDLVRGHSNTSVGPLPSLDQEEAFQIFQENFELGDLNSLVNRNLLHSVLKRCLFSGNYHALALKALGRYVKRVCVLESLDKIEHNLSLILQGIGNSTVLQNVEDLILLNYLNLAAEKKHMFLDIVAVVMAASSSEDGVVTYENAHQWLSILYKEYSKSMITNLIYELALDGLIQIENIDDKSAEKMIRVHDLYSDLAQRETARSARFFTDTSTKSVEEIEWERLERVILRQPHHNPHFIEELQQQECRKLQVLCASNLDFRSGIHLDLMPSLCVLDLKRGTLSSVKNWTAATGLAIVHLEDLECAPPLKPIPSIPCLEELIIRNVKTVEGPPNLHVCQHLKTLVLAEASVFKEGEEYWEASYFNSLTNLESLEIRHFNSTTRVLNLNALINLQFLAIERCKSIERTEGLDALKNLRWLYVKHCPYLRNLDGLSGLLQLEVIYVINADLKKMPDLSGLTCLERLELCDNESMEEVVGGLSPALKYVQVSGCEALKKMPDLSGLTCLERLELRDNKSMEEVVGGLSPALEDVQVRGCEALKKMPDLSGLTCLERLELRDNKSMKEVMGGLSPALKYIQVRGCEALKKTPDLSGLICLKRLELRDNESMEEVMGALNPALKNVQVSGCEALKKTPDLSSLTCLESLQLRDNKSMEEMVGGLSPALKYVEVSGCGALKKMPDMSGLTCLERLEVRDNKSMDEMVGGLSPALKYVEVSGCGALKKMPDLSGLTCLERLELCANESMEEVGGENLTCTLKCLSILHCRSLRSFPSLIECVHLRKLSASAYCLINNIYSFLEKQTNLQNLHLISGDWKSMERLISGVTHLQVLTIQECDSLLKLDVGCLPSNLLYLSVCKCKMLEEIGDLRALHHNLQTLVVSECASLKKVGAFCIPLKNLLLYDCGSLQESSIPDVSLIPIVSIRRCGKLNDFLR